MNKKDNISENNGASDEHKNLEEKIDALERLKYVILPAAITVGTYFIPEIKNKYNNLSYEKKDQYRKKGLMSASIASITIAAFSGYKLYKEYYKKQEKINLKNNS